ncbi:MAG: SEC-C metal-binding domain-containing protein, partial [Planctomycetota bacterium]|nr:SEC-C metal-binding domain-containing protein [Planctomycetota bacterium]
SLVRMLSSEAKRCGVPRISQDPDFGDAILDELPACMTILGREVSEEELLEWGSHLSLGFETVNTEEMDPYRFESDADLDDDIDEGDDEESDDDLDSDEEDGDGEDDGKEESAEPVTIRNPFERVGRNEPCPCGSGKKFKKCCGQR